MNYRESLLVNAWRPGCGLTFLVIQLEEAGTLLAELDDETIKTIVKAAPRRHASPWSEPSQTAHGPRPS